MKRKIVVSNLFLLLLYIITGCSNSLSSNDYNSVFDSKDCHDCITYVENQSFFNRIILDYYEQKIANSGTVIKNGEAISFLINNGIEWRLSMSGSDDEVVFQPQTDIKISDIQIYDIVGKNKKGVYIIRFNSRVCPQASGFLNDNSLMFVNGSTLSFPNHQFIPMVWYQGAILFPSEAFQIGLVSIEEMCNCLGSSESPSSIIGINPLFSSYDENVKPIEIEKVFSLSQSNLAAIQNDYIDYLLQNSINTFDKTVLSSESVHLVDSFGKINDKEMFLIASDHVPIQSSLWKEDFVLGSTILHKFFYYEPTIYCNHSFYSLTEAYNQNILSNEEIEIIKNRFN